jgi:hypothetical protein
MDVHHLFQLALPIGLICGLLQLAVWLRDRSRLEPLLWAVSDFTGVIGGALITARETVPWWVSSTAGNTLIVGSLLLAWAGLRRCVGLGIPTRIFVGTAVGFFVFFHGLWWLWNDLGLRVLISSIVLCIGNAGIAFDLARGGDHSDRRIRGTLSIVFAAHALFFLFRAATAMTLQAEDEFLRTGGLQAFTVLVATLKLMIWNGGALVLLRGDRYRDSAASLA